MHLYTLEILGGVFITYLLTSFLFKPALHVWLWRWVLLISFVVTAVTGVVYALGIEGYVSISSYKKELRWAHIEFGLVMVMVTFFHLWQHRRSFLK